jgi:carboxypeptidase family protein
MRTKLLTAWFALVATYGQETGGLKGLVVDEAGAAIASADIQLKHHRNPAVYRKVQAASDGSFQFNDVPAGNYDLVIMSPGLISRVMLGIRVRSGAMVALSSMTLPNGPPTCSPGPSYLPKIENVRLESGDSQVVGSVIETKNGHPMSGASVVVVKGRTKVKNGQVKTDSQGRFKLVGLPEGSYNLRVFAPGYSDFVVDRAPVKSGEETRIQRLEMRACPVKGRCKPIKYNQVWVACQ